MRTYLVLLILCSLVTGCAAPVATAALPLTVLEPEQPAFTPVNLQTECDPCTEGTILFPPADDQEAGQFPRGTGKPLTEERTFHLDWDGDVCLNVTNHGCASTTITLNGEEIISPDQFNPDVGQISATKYLPGLPSDEKYPFSVTVTSIPDCSVDVEVRSCDPNPVVCPNDPPNEAAPGVNWSGCDLSGEYLAHRDLTGAKLVRADLSGAYLVSTDLRWTLLLYADLTGADLSDAYLLVADLRYANLTGANLSGADLHDSFMYYADLTNADLTNADMSGAHLYGVTWSNTTCPDGTNSDTNGLGYCTR